MSRARSVSRVGVETTLTISSNGNVGFGSTIPTTRVDVAGNLNVTGVTTSTSFVGNVTGNLTGTASTATAARTAFGLSGTPDITVGIVTATVISAGSTVGTAGSVLTSTGTGLQWTSVAVGPQVTTQLASLSNLIGYNNAGLRSDAANGRLEVFGTGNFRVFTSPGTFVVNPGISSIRVRVVGAGGNGGSGTLGSQSPPSFPGGVGGGGGGGGGYAHKVITSFTAPRTYTITVGSAPGGTSSFGAVVSATGGSNGGTVNTQGIGGTGTGGDVNFSGSSGILFSSIPSSHPFYYVSPPAPYGWGSLGGAAGTQLGNSISFEVPGLPALNVPSLVVFDSPYPSIPATFYHSASQLYDTTINRFPFDIFNGVSGSCWQFSSGGGANPGTTYPYLSKIPAIKNGINGGGGSPGWGVNYLYGQYTTATAGNGGIGAGGGGGSVIATGGGSGNVTGSGGNGGIGGGGGGGAGAPISSGTGGTGGSGIVIVEW